jgi:predicted RNA binding protein YcfA (HicA-like mRNA interferase family)
MPKIPIISAKLFLKYLQRHGCILLNVRGSHYKIINPHNGKITVVPIHSNRDLRKGLFAAVLSQLEIDIEQFIDFINKN